MKRSEPPKPRAERLQKILARAGLGSRRSVEDLIRQRLVTINGTIAELGAKADLVNDSIKVEGRRIRLPERHRYVVLHKPSGVMTTLKDPEGRDTVIDYIPRTLRSGLFPVGRLDYQSEGLILLTTDGAFADRVMHPRHGCSKVYLAKVRGEPTARDIQRLEAGIRLEGRKTKPCDIESKRMSSGRQASANTWWQVTLREGRTRQVREMFQRIGHPVQRLRRVAIGSLRDRYLKAGSSRDLSAEEVELLLAGKEAHVPKKPAPAKGAARRAKPKGPTTARDGSPLKDGGARKARKKAGRKVGKKAGSRKTGGRRSSVRDESGGPSPTTAGCQEVKLRQGGSPRAGALLVGRRDEGPLDEGPLDGGLVDQELVDQELVDEELVDEVRLGLRRVLPAAAASLPPVGAHAEE